VYVYVHAYVCVCVATVLNFSAKHIDRGIPLYGCHTVLLPDMELG